MVSQSIKAIILAGGMAQWVGKPKALLVFNDIPVVLHIFNALQKLSIVKKIAIVGYPEVLSVLPENCIKAEASSDLWANTQIGIKAVEPEGEDCLMLCAADMPFVTTSSLEAFLKEALKTGADIVYPAVPLSAFQRLGLSGVSRTSLRLREGTFTGGNLFLIQAKVLPNIFALADKAIRSRKSLWQLGQIAGWKLLFKWLFSHMPIVGNAFLVSVNELEKRGEELLKCRCKAVIADLPELAFDVDKPEDYELAQIALAKNSQKFHG